VTDAAPPPEDSASGAVAGAPVPPPRVALVTGASRGIGAAVARALAADGVDVILTCLHQRAAAELLADEIRAGGRRAWVAQFDVKDATQCRASVTALLAETDIHIVVNNAGVTADAAFPALSRAAWHDVIDTSLDGFFNVTQPLVMPMVRRKWGRIINIASVSGVDGNRGQVNYSAAKAGLIGATKALAIELASRHITVNAIAPGLIDTEMIASVPVDEILKHIPMKRLGKPEEVADLVAYLASDRAAYMTGQVLVLSGGL
jgi:3-oxoacyl-[acyl-carrier protein] reductase